MLNLPNLPKVYFIINALDERHMDLQPLLKLIIEYALLLQIQYLVSS
jgi:hypothetical protein